MVVVTAWTLVKKTVSLRGTRSIISKQNEELVYFPRNRAHIKSLVRKFDKDTVMTVNEIT